MSTSTRDMVFRIIITDLYVEADDREGALEELGATIRSGRIFHHPGDPKVDIVDMDTGKVVLGAMLSEAEPKEEG